MFYFRVLACMLQPTVRALRWRLWFLYSVIHGCLLSENMLMLCIFRMPGCHSTSSAKLPKPDTLWVCAHHFSSPGGKLDAEVWLAQKCGCLTSEQPPAWWAGLQGSLPRTAVLAGCTLISPSSQIRCLGVNQQTWSNCLLSITATPEVREQK